MRPVHPGLMGSLSSYISWADQKLGRKDVLLLRVHLADADMSSDCRFLDLSSSAQASQDSATPPSPTPSPTKCCKSGGTRSLNGSKGEAKVAQSHRRGHFRCVRTHNNRCGTDGMPGWPTSADLGTPTSVPGWKLGNCLNSCF